MFVARVNMTLLTEVISGLAALAVGVALARSLGVEGRGAFAALFSAVALTYAISNLGVHQASIYLMGTRKLEDSVVAANGVLMLVMSGLIGGLLLIGGVLFFGDRLGAGGLPYWSFALAVPILSAYRLVRSLLQGANRIMAMNSVRLADVGFRGTSILALWLLGSLTITLAVFAWLTSLVIATALGAILLGTGYFRWRTLVQPKIAALREQVSFGAKGQGGILSQAVGHRVDLLLILAFLGTREVGLYVVAVFVSESIRVVGTSVGVVLTPRLTQMPGDRASELTGSVCRHTILVALAVSAAVAAAAPLLIPGLFGSRFEDSVTAVFWLLPGVVAFSGSRILASYFFAIGRPLMISYISIVAFVAMIALDLMLIPAFGIKGAAAASSLASVAALIFALNRYHSISGRPAIEAAVPRLSDVVFYLRLAEALLARIAALTVQARQALRSVGGHEGPR